ncbi:MAG: vitamin K epoxide reductase family protein [Chloroflexota bacterium]|nr:vitamin K epoxide reductase family protein [Chloroflexota bacterium]
MNKVYIGNSLDIENVPAAHGKIAPWKLLVQLGLSFVVVFSSRRHQEHKVFLSVLKEILCVFCGFLVKLQNTEFVKDLGRKVLDRLQSQELLMQRKKTFLKILPLILILVLFFTQVAQAQEDTYVVQAMLFYSHSCPHCAQVINEVLPPIFMQYGNQVEVFYVDVQSEKGRELYQNAVKYYEIPDNRIGVPTLIVGDIVLVGSGEIPDELPGIIEDGLKNGGIPWPDFPGVEEEIEKAITRLTATAQAQATAQSGATETPTPTLTATQPSITETPSASIQTATPTQLEPTEEVVASPIDPTQEKNSEDTADASGVIALGLAPQEITMAEKFQRDLVGNILAVFVLVGMIWSVIMVGLRIFFPPPARNSCPRWVIPALSVVGLVVAGYLSYVEITLTEAVCGPVGDCNTVQQSQYARLFGVLPIGVLGMAGYVGILVSWAVQHYGPKNLRTLAHLALLGMTLFGTFFSIYLTFLEPFVIGATCAWCLASAVVITLQLWVASRVTD